MATTRTLLSGTAIAFMLAHGTAFAQDATIYYETPTIRHGQPVTDPGATIITPVQHPISPAIEAGAPEPRTVVNVEDSVYLTAPQVQAVGDVRFVSGGTGASEKAWFTSHASEFDLKVSYNDTTGHNLAGVNASLTNSSGETVLNTTTEGPFLLVDAKPGTYTLTSTYEGQSKTNKVTLGKGTRNLGVTFKDVENPDL